MTEQDLTITAKIPADVLPSPVLVDGTRFALGFTRVLLAEDRWADTQRFVAGVEASGWHVGIVRSDLSETVTLFQINENEEWHGAVGFEYVIMAHACGEIMWVDVSQSIIGDMFPGPEDQNPGGLYLPSLWVPE